MAVYRRHAQLSLAGAILAMQLGDGFGLPPATQAVKLCALVVKLAESSLKEVEVPSPFEPDVILKMDV
jgi:hypothetical protein